MNSVVGRKSRGEGADLCPRKTYLQIKQILDKIVKQTKVGQDNWQIDQFEKLTLVQIFITLLCATAVLYVMIW